MLVSVLYISLTLDINVQAWKDVPEEVNKFRSSEWFVRGWTLQEIIAARSVLFYSKSWAYLGSKEELSSLVHEITRIDLYVLQGGSPHELSIARRMCWASSRKTTKVEDTAYCLLGIVNINMP